MRLVISPMQDHLNYMRENIASKIPEGSTELRYAKEMLLHSSVNIYKASNGMVMLKDAAGYSRPLTMRERLAVWLLGGRTEIRQ